MMKKHDEDECLNSDEDEVDNEVFFNLGRAREREFGDRKARRRRSRSRSRSRRRSRKRTRSSSRSRSGHRMHEPVRQKTPQRYDRDEPIPGCSRDVDETVTQFIRDTEAGIATVHDLPGMVGKVNSDKVKERLKDLDHFASCLNLSKTFLHSAMVDESYQVVGAHVDDSLKQKIIKHEYVDFAKLLPKDRVKTQTDDRLEMVNRGGRTYWVPYADRDLGQITGYSKWDLAFRVFSDVYTRSYPHKAYELIQYHHLIHSASQTYVWDNVYSYDIDFRLHISRNPERSWALILQQAWSFRLKDKLTVNRSGFNNAQSHMNGKKICFKFNRGHCPYGSNCKFDHRCGVCGKFGHGAFNCRRGSGGNNYSYFSDRKTGERSRQANQQRQGGNNGQHGNQQDKNSHNGKQ